MSVSLLPLAPIPSAPPYASICNDVDTYETLGDASRASSTSASASSFDTKPSLVASPSVGADLKVTLTATGETDMGHSSGTSSAPTVTSSSPLPTALHPPLPPEDIVAMILRVMQRHGADAEVQARGSKVLVCMYVCMYVRIYIYYIHIYILYVYICVCIYRRDMYICMCIYARAHMHTHTHTHTRTRCS